MHLKLLLPFTVGTLLWMVFNQRLVASAVVLLQTWVLGLRQSSGETQL